MAGKDIPLEEVVPGDIVSLNAGDSVPQTLSFWIQKISLWMRQTLTGETYLWKKTVGPLPVETPLSRRTNSLFMGTHVISGSATAAVVFTGKDRGIRQNLGALKLRPQETEFERAWPGSGIF